MRPEMAFVIGLPMFAICIYCVMGMNNAIPFMIGVLFQAFFVMFLVPFYLGRVVSLDPSGKAVGASSGFFMIGSAIGPFVGGIIIDYAGLRTLGITGVLLCLVILVSTLSISKKYA